MPPVPRTEDFVYKHEVDDEPPPTNIDDFPIKNKETNNDHNNNHAKGQQQQQQQQQHLNKKKARLGKLRLKSLHGILGMSSLPIVISSLYHAVLKSKSNNNFQDDDGDVTRIWITLAIVATSLLALSSISLLKQVPKCTLISSKWNVIPPHREAFKRTIAIVGYLDLRLAHEIFGILGRKMFGSLLLGYHLYFFTPVIGSFDNGNTWVFVVPMFLGFGIDAYHQLQFNRGDGADEGALGAILSSKYEQKSLSPFHSSDWNNHVVTVPYLLTTLLCAQCIAFMFTLGFRNILIPIRYGYWYAFHLVLCLCGGMGWNAFLLLHNR